MILMAAAWPQCHFVGVDVNEDSLEQAVRNAQSRQAHGPQTSARLPSSAHVPPLSLRRPLPCGFGPEVSGWFQRKETTRIGLTNVEWINLDLNFPTGRAAGLDGRFDVVFAFDCIHDLKAPDAALRGCFAMLKEGGVMCMVDIKAHTGIQVPVLSCFELDSAGSSSRTPPKMCQTSTWSRSLLPCSVL